MALLGGAGNLREWALLKEADRWGVSLRYSGLDRLPLFSLPFAFFLFLLFLSLSLFSMSQNKSIVLSGNYLGHFVTVMVRRYGCWPLVSLRGLSYYVSFSWLLSSHGATHHVVI